MVPSAAALSLSKQGVKGIDKIGEEIRILLDTGKILGS